ncbi:MAG: hypothetical protein ABIP55_01900 [Tepidisphaeraceae bacterium]
MTALGGVLLACVAMLTGCVSNHSSKPPATMPAVATRLPGYWFDQPGVTSISATDFETLWRACEDAARRFGFRPDRQDFRRGVLTTEPLISKQFFEFWRGDVVTASDLADSSIATHRRTLRFEIQKAGDDKFTATPRVVVERHAQSERPVTSSVYLRNVFRTQKPRDRSYGTAETDRGVYLPRQYWYATGRDEALEQQVARKVESRLKKT